MPVDFMLTVPVRWEHICKGEAKAALEAILPDLLRTRRWFGGKGRAVGAARIVETVPIPSRSKTAMLLMIRVEYGDDATETYLLPVTAAFGVLGAEVQRDFPHAVVARLRVEQDDHEAAGVLYDALWDPDFSRALVEAIGRGSRFNGTAGTVVASSTEAYGTLVNEATALDPSVMRAEQSNTSVAYSDRVILKLYRRLSQGSNPDLEFGRVLTQMKFSYVPPVAGALEYAQGSDEPITLAMLQGFVRNEGDAWRHSLDALDRFFMRVAGGDVLNRPPPHGDFPLLELAGGEYPPVARELIGLYLQSAERLGQRTAELHLALSQITDDPAFAPEPLTPAYQEARYRSMVQLTHRTLALLRGRLHAFSAPWQAEARRLLALEPAIERKFGDFRRLGAMIPRIRCHGDYHLGQVLCTGSDFMIIDFEGEPARSLAERRIKHPAVLDIAGMVRSFQYAPFAFLQGKRGGAVAPDPLSQHSEAWARFWCNWASAAFLKAYLGIAARSRFWPQSEADVRILFDAYVLEKAVYELNYELNNRPGWVAIPLGGILHIVEASH